VVPEWGTLGSWQQAAVKGGRRPAERTLEGCFGCHPRLRTKWVGAWGLPQAPPVRTGLAGRIRLTQDVALKRAKDDGCVPFVRGARDRARRRTSSATCDDRQGCSCTCSAAEPWTAAASVSTRRDS